MVDLPRLVSEHFGSCHFEKNTRGKEEVGIDLQEDGHLSVCTFVLKLEGERKKKKKKVRLQRAQSLKKTYVIFPRHSSARGGS